MFDSNTRYTVAVAAAGTFNTPSWDLKSSADRIVPLWVAVNYPVAPNAGATVTAWIQECDDNTNFTNAAPLHETITMVAGDPYPRNRNAPYIPAARYGRVQIIAGGTTPNYGSPLVHVTDRMEEVKTV